MFITKKHISRRKVLKGAGVSLALPFLDAMVPAGTALAQTAAAPKLRTGFFYLPHGAIMGNTSHGPSMDKWTPSGSGADFKLSQILASLEPHKKYVSSFGNLENAATAGSVHTFTPATWLSATRPDTGGPKAHMATTLDQVMAKVISQDTPLPSLEVSSETIAQQAAGGGGSYTTLSFRDAESPLPMDSIYHHLIKKIHFRRILSRNRNSINSFQCCRFRGSRYVHPVHLEIIAGKLSYFFQGDYIIFWKAELPKLFLRTVLVSLYSKVMPRQRDTIIQTQLVIRPAYAGCEHDKEYYNNFFH